jgi:hypothetical protein
LHAFVAAATGFLLAVLWFDLMFDVQTRHHEGVALPPDVLSSISGYYRRVTTDAFPMNRLVAAVMLGNLIAIVAEIVTAGVPWWISWGSLAIAGSGIVPSLTHTVPNAVRLGSRVDSLEQQSVLARSMYRAHRGAFARMSAVLALQLSAVWL